jgi:hypothetical protein
MKPPPIAAPQSVASAIRNGTSPFLPFNSVMQSDLRFGNSHTRLQQARCLGLYGALTGASTVAAMSGWFGDAAQAQLLGIGLPGAGFLHWAAGGQAWLATGCALAGVACFVASLVLWFAMGNVLAPLTYWIVLAWLAGRPQVLGLQPDLPAPAWPWVIAPGLWLTAALAWTRQAKTAPLPQANRTPKVISAIPSDPTDEMSLDDLKRQHLLLDRALQPVDAFNGFEWRDQFQTAAVRYQVNFTAYALALAQRRYAPAAEVYLSEAQQNLLGKIGNRRLWRYWRIENAWGRLRLGADPVPEANIMYSGFTLLQMALSGGAKDLVLHHAAREWRRYSQSEIAALLEQQYRRSPYGLLACEPNWIYPLCNLITASGIKTADSQLGTQRWQGLADDFRDSLHREGTQPDGSFIAFRSALTGIAPPAAGGIVMQASPCLFLNALDSDLAAQHWSRVRKQLAQHKWERLFWPVDVGNYGFSRASSYAAAAAAAVELGDSETARECLQRLDAECPSREHGGVIHRDHASLWAHALEMIARTGKTGGFRDASDSAPNSNGPRLAKAAYPDVLIARAVAQGRSLELVLYSGSDETLPLIELSGLLPERHYHTGHPDQPFLRTNSSGRALLKVALRGRTALTIKPVV